MSTYENKIEVCCFLFLEELNTEYFNEEIYKYHIKLGFIYQV